MGDFSQNLAAWSYGIAAVAFLAFMVQLGLVWRGSLRGSIVLGAVVLSFFWSLSSFGFFVTGSQAFWVICNLVDLLRTGAWLALLLALLYMPKHVKGLVIGK